jgi:hypothetical protein
LKSLDSLGTGIFSHDFAATTGTPPPLQQRFDAFGDQKPSLLAMVSFLLGSVIPPLANIPSERTRLIDALRADMHTIAAELYDKATKKEDTLSDSGLDQSILGSLGA